MTAHDVHSEPTTFLRRWIFSLDHKVIAKQFLWYGIAFLGLGGVLALLIRWQLAWPHRPVPIVGHLLLSGAGGAISPALYNALITMHGTIMIFFAITPILIGAYGNFCIPLQIGARDMVFPTLNMLSFWTMVASGVTLCAGFLVPGGPARAGWTAYPPLSTAVGTPGAGQTLWIVALILAGTSTLMGAINYITTVIRLRAPGMTYFRLPLTVWGLFLTAVLNVLFVPVIASGLVLLLFDRIAGTRFFIAAAGATPGDPILYQHLFWIFGHPEVYILILPAWGIVSDLLAVFSRKPAFGYRATALAMTAITAMSAVVYGHHMFTTGMQPLLAQGFMVLTMLVSIPSAVFFLNWLGTLWRGALRLDSPMLFALGVVFVFALGGLTGLYLGAISTDIYLHDSAFVVGHFHYTMAASVLFGGFAATYYWFPKMFGRALHEGLARLHFWLTFVPLNLVFFPMLILGRAGMQRRIADPTAYDFLKPLAPINHFITYAAFVLGAAQIVFVGNVAWSLMRGRRAEANPWKATTLEWTVPSPPPHENFAEIPTVRVGPHEHSRPDQADRDWLLQTEAPPGGHGEPLAGAAE